MIQCILYLSLLARAESVSPEQLKTALAKYQAIERLEVDFQQTKTFKDMDLKLKASGRLTVTPDRIVWRELKPESQTVTLENDTMTTESHGEKETFRAGQGGAASRRALEDLLAWLKLDANAIARGYSIERTGANRMRFEAKRKNASIKTIDLQMSKEGHVRSLALTEASGDTIEIEFAKPKSILRK